MIADNEGTLTQTEIDALLHASREADEGPTQLVRRVEAAVCKQWRAWLSQRANAVETASPLAAKALRNAADDFEA